MIPSSDEAAAIIDRWAMDKSPYYLREASALTASALRRYNLPWECAVWLIKNPSLDALDGHARALSEWMAT